MADHYGFDFSAITRAANDALTVRRVFGEAYEHDGQTVVPVAKVMGCTGSGGGGGEEGRESADVTPGQREGYGGGGAFALRVKPIGVFVIDTDGVRWKPAVDVNRVILGGQIVGLALGACLAMVLVARSRRRR
jgi:uncharacterized spore protein YtfJ